MSNFTVSSKELAIAHGVGHVTINAWAKQGAFPFARSEDLSVKKVFRKYHTDCLNMTLGAIRSNIKIGRYISHQETFPRSTNISLANKPKAIGIQTLVRIEEKLDNLISMLRVTR